MSWECLTMLGYVTQFLNSDEGGAQMRTVLEDGGSPSEIIELLANNSRDEETARLLRLEFAQLPHSTVPAIIGAWKMAADAGKEYRVTSVPPAAGTKMQYARTGRTTITTHHDEEGIIVEVSHMPRFHAEWYKPHRQVAA